VRSSHSGANHRHRLDIKQQPVQQTFADTRVRETRPPYGIENEDEKQNEAEWEEGKKIGNLPFAPARVARALLRLGAVPADVALEERSVSISLYQRRERRVRGRGRAGGE
jgi:hypothetical protein